MLMAIGKFFTNANVNRLKNAVKMFFIIYVALIALVGKYILRLRSDKALEEEKEKKQERIMELEQRKAKILKRMGQ